ncbi:hypothetical protein [Mesorhizobium sp. B2-6-7]|uniref:hypothetical protein n=1 Tax=Mesorhizobium sp. B2-6-7 TaxID=2589910 RepID=UPI0011289C81|nr:hypothetical protein [Mesorhizobium sp. B2-6-7]TPJ70457.1 hypothetical protein FJ462_07105 [Mesorhizobium sp. B2-6-7]
MARPATAAVRLLTGEREPVRLATTVNIDVDGGGLLTIDGVLTEVGDRILVKDQTDGSENGIRTASTGQWYRAADARTAREMQKGTTVHVAEGSTNAGKTFVFTSLNPQIGDDAITIAFYQSDDTIGAVNDAIDAGLTSIGAAGDSEQADISAAGAAQLAAIGEAGADVTAIKAGDTDASGFGFVIDEDNMASDSASKVPTQQSVKAFVDALGLPSLSGADAGKALFVNGAGNGYEADFVDQNNVTATPTDALRITIGNVTNPARFGTWDKTGAVDGSAAFTAAVASNKFVELGDGDFKISTKAVIANSQRRVIGAGKAITRLISSHASNHVIEIAAGLSDVIVEDLTTTRIVAPSVGAAGIGALGQLSTSCIRRVSSFASYYGMLLLSTGYSQLQDIFLSNNTGDGLRIQNTAASGPCQWYIDGLLSQANDGIGIRVQSVAGPAGLLLGDWRGVRTFANSSFGIALQGLVGTPVYGMRLHESFLGTDGNTELYLDTYGYGHKIHDVFMEIAGTGLTGSALTTPASGVGWGILGTAHNDDIRATDCTISGCSSGGFYSEATLTRVATTLFKSMGTGVNIADGGKYRENGCDFVSVTTPRTFVANPYNAHIVGSGSSLASTTGANPNATRIPAGVTIGVATAGDPLAGGMNVAAGLWKNNTAYANP